MPLNRHNVTWFIGRVNGPGLYDRPGTEVVFTRHPDLPGKVLYTARPFPSVTRGTAVDMISLECAKARIDPLRDAKGSARVLTDPRINAGLDNVLDHFFTVQMPNIRREQTEADLPTNTWFCATALVSQHHLQTGHPVYVIRPKTNPNFYWVGTPEGGVVRLHITEARRVLGFKHHDDGSLVEPIPADVKPVSDAYTLAIME